MKKLASIFMTLTILLTGYCQELPKNNEKILKFAERRFKMILPVGYLVGKGICESLAMKAICKTKYGYRYYYGRRESDARFGNRIENRKDWLPGDIIIFHGFKMLVGGDPMDGWLASQMREFEKDGFTWSEESKEKYIKSCYLTVSNHVGIISDVKWDGDVYTITYIHQSKPRAFISKQTFCSKDNINEKFTVRRIE